MKTKYEVWHSEAQITFSDKNGIIDQKEKGLIDSNAILLYAIEADTWEEAMAVHHIKMG